MWNLFVQAAFGFALTVLVVVIVNTISPIFPKDTE